MTELAYMRNLNEPLPGDPVTLVPSAARTTGGSGPVQAVGSASTLRVDLAVTAASGTTPALTVTLEHSPDGLSWTTHSTFTAMTTAGTQRKVTSGLDRFIRCSWAITGTTPSLTFAIAGELV